MIGLHTYRAVAATLALRVAGVTRHVGVTVRAERTAVHALTVNSERFTGKTRASALQEKHRHGARMRTRTAVNTTRTWVCTSEVSDKHPTSKHW